MSPALLLLYGVNRYLVFFITPGITILFGPLNLPGHPTEVALGDHLAHFFFRLVFARGPDRDTGCQGERADQGDVQGIAQAAGLGSGERHAWKMRPDLLVDVRRGSVAGIPEFAPIGKKR